jgi:hypothetical protein
LYPGTPLLLEYGWNHPTNTFLGQKQKLLFSMVNYTINIDGAGQAILTVNGYAFNQYLDFLIGDDGKLDTTKGTDGTIEEKNKPNGFFSNYNNLKKFLDNLSDSQKNSTQNSNDYSQITGLAKSYTIVEKNVRGRISNNFSTYIGKLSKIPQMKNVNWYDSKKKAVKTVAFHDVIVCLLEDTLKCMSALIPGTQSFEVIYGCFNEQCLDFSNKTIANFPVDVDRLIRWTKEQGAKGKRSITIKELLDELGGSYLSNDEFIKGCSKPSKKAVFAQPTIVINLYNSYDPITKKTSLQLAILDAKFGIPMTTNQLLKIPGGKTTSDNAVQTILQGTSIPTITLGHANSFIKDISFSMLGNPQMEAMLIERASRDSIPNLRDPVVFRKFIEGEATTPLSLPLQGRATMMGHPSWLPFRSFFMSSGIFFIDAIYTIQSVTHKLSNRTYETEITFLWH